MILKLNNIYNSDKFDYVVWSVFLIIGLTGTLNHEIWLDEAQSG